METFSKNYQIFELYNVKANATMWYNQVLNGSNGQE